MSSRHDANDNYPPRSNNYRPHHRREVPRAPSRNPYLGNIDRYWGQGRGSWRPPRHHHDDRYHPPELERYDSYAPAGYDLPERRGRSNSPRGRSSRAWSRGRDRGRNSPRRQGSRVRSPRRDRSPRRQRSRVRSPRRDRDHDSPRRQRIRVRSPRGDRSRNSSRRERSRIRSPRRSRSRNRSRPPRRERRRNLPPSQQRLDEVGIKERDGTPARETTARAPITFSLPPPSQQQRRSTGFRPGRFTATSPTRGRLSRRQSLDDLNRQEDTTTEARVGPRSSSGRIRPSNLGNSPRSPEIPRRSPPVGAPLAPRSQLPRSPIVVPTSEPRAGPLPPPHAPLQRNIMVFFGQGYRYAHYVALSKQYGEATLVRQGRTEMHGYIHFRTHADAMECLRNRRDCQWAIMPVVEGQDDRDPEARRRR
ncbi:hypothetical protein K440DRAFT_636328 [Wilcoxina mikolae CBS 423.85]|nr:hypothetical protein K440DRAFT_636328 [Wilcoxina mikolae CBS 423.85]